METTMERVPFDLERFKNGEVAFSSNGEEHYFYRVDAKDSFGAFGNSRMYIEWLTSESAVKRGWTMLPPAQQEDKILNDASKASVKIINKPSTLGEQVEKAQGEIKEWPEGRINDLQLQGGNLLAPKEPLIKSKIANSIIGESKAYKDRRSIEERCNEVLFDEEPSVETEQMRFVRFGGWLHVLDGVVPNEAAKASEDTMWEIALRDGSICADYIWDWPEHRWRDTGSAKDVIAIRCLR